MLGARPKRAQCIEQIPLLHPEVLQEQEVYAAKVADVVTFGSNIRGSADYRKELAKVLICRSLQKMTEEKICR